VDVGICFGRACLCACLDSVVAALMGVYVDIDVGGRGRGDGLVRSVEEDGDWRLEDAWHLLEGSDTVACSPTKAIELGCGIADLFQGLLERVYLAAIRAQDGVDHALEEASSCSVGVEDADRGYRHREGCIVFNLGETSAQARRIAIGDIPALRASPATCFAVRVAAH
jgi:hypothetical protein